MEFHSMLFIWYRLFGREDSDFLAINDESLVVGFDVETGFQVGWIVLELIFHVFDVHEGIVDGRDFDACFVLDGGSEDESADTAKTIDSNHWGEILKKIL